MTDTQSRIVPRVVRPAAMDWVKFDAELARDGSVDPVEKALYAALASFVDTEDRDSDPDPDGDDVPTRAVLAACIGRSVDTVDRVTKRLEERGLIRVHRRRDPDNPRSHLPSVYELLDHERWDERAAARAAARRAAREGRGGSRTDAARGSRTDAARGSRTDAARGSRTDAARGSRTGAAVPLPPRDVPPPPPSHGSATAAPATPEREEEEAFTPADNPDPTPGEDVRRGRSGTAPEPRSDEDGADVDEVTAWVLELPWRRPPNRNHRQALSDLVAAAWADGWTPNDLRAELTAELEGVRSLYAVWSSRLANLPAPPAPTPTAAGKTSGELPPKCDDPECDPVDRTLDRREDGLLLLVPCPRCNPTSPDYYQAGAAA
ncbi:hypothetical protein [Planomonospora sp. ID82291]|uniref:hypothetical protein n=1 Tax=Planomonospora sp. ID82291 TaxID=2738136 RepID=UPI0018C3FED8|nr:hypothetical protein [Planomonospora sp. ID82291]MBG0819070.1 hypothetical protein [Planomonospora sp. ID82291]